MAKKGPRIHFGSVLGVFGVPHRPSKSCRVSGVFHDHFFGGCGCVWFFFSFFLFLIEVGGWWLDCKKVVLDALCEPILAIGTVIMEEFPGAPSLGRV